MPLLYKLQIFITFLALHQISCSVIPDIPENETLTSSFSDPEGSGFQNTTSPRNVPILHPGVAVPCLGLVFLYFSIVAFVASLNEPSQGTFC